MLKLPMRRATTKLKAKDLRGALADASLGVALDPTYAKAMHKRSHAKQQLGLLLVSWAVCEHRFLL